LAGQRYGISFSVMSSTVSTLLFNASPRATYQAGAYDGFYPYTDLVKQGDFGLGATDENDGELLVLNGAVYRSRVNGVTDQPQPDEKTPFATVTFFKPTETFSRENMTMEDFQRKFDLEHSPKNRIYAIKITGSFPFVEVGSGEKQLKPYRPLAEVFQEYVISRKENVSGDLVAFRCPSILKGIDYVGFHYHFVDAPKQWGGHVYKFAIKHAEVSVHELNGYSVVMPSSDDVLGLNLDLFR
jgi:acetolactate decarboxylase